jgi:cytochrome c oxidase subunit 3
VSRPGLDVSKLPAFAFGARDPLWWGVLGLMLIEGTMFAICFASYLYIRGGFDVFPPTPLNRPAWLWAAAGQACLWLSVPPIWASMKAAKRADAVEQRRWLLFAAVPSLAFVACRGFELAYLGQTLRWDQHAYGSIFWFILAMHTLHGITGCCEDFALFAVLLRGPVEKKLLVDVHSNGFYWCFVVGSGAAAFALLYLDPAVLRVLW